MSSTTREADPPTRLAMPRRGADHRVAWVAAVWMAVAALVSAVPLPMVLRVVVVLPAILVLPGFLLTLALLPPSLLGGRTRVVLSVATSIAVSVVAGTLLALVTGRV